MGSYLSTNFILQGSNPRPRIYESGWQISVALQAQNWKILYPHELQNKNIKGTLVIENYGGSIVVSFLPFYSDDYYSKYESRWSLQCFST